MMKHPQKPVVRNQVAFNYLIISFSDHLIAISTT